MNSHEFDLLVKNNQHTFAVKDGRVAAVGTIEEHRAAQVVNASGQTLLPGFVDCHTHVLYAGNRADENTLRLKGASYQKIAQAGGGILSTVRAVQQASEGELIEQTMPRLRALQAEGVTGVEIKSGYGLSTADELKMLRAIKKLKGEIKMDIYPTFLGAHAVPAGVAKEHYVEEILDHMLPAVAEENLATACDVYVETIAFDLSDAERIFTKSRKLGLHCRIHAEQFSSMGGSRLAARYKALSADHLEHTTEEDVLAMKEADMAAVLLPGAFYFLRETKLPPVELFRKHGVPMAVASDMNPGSSTVASFQAVMHMAATFFRLTPEEIFAGVTTHAAQVVADPLAGGLAVGQKANFSLWDIPAADFLTYQLGGVRPSAVFYEGKQVI